MTREGWLNLLRFLATAVGLGVLAASIYFSASFFGVKNSELVWIGILIGIGVTMLELTWRKPGMRANTTINVLAVSAYLYGIVTNSLGIMLAWGYNLDPTSPMYILKDVFQLILAFFPGIILEVLAEPLVSWGLTGDAMADLLGNGMDMINKKIDTERDPYANYESKNEARKREVSSTPNEPEPPSFDPTYDTSHPMGRAYRTGQNQHQNQPGYHPMFHEPEKVLNGNNRVNGNNQGFGSSFGRSPSSNNNGGGSPRKGIRG